MIRRGLIFGTLVISVNSVMAQPPDDRRPGGPGEPGRRGSRVMAALDSDSDGMLSAEEIAGAATALLKLDADGNGQLSAAELRPPRRAEEPRGGRGRGRGPRGENGDDSGATLARLLAFDKNQDGQLASDELPQRLQSLIARADQNQDKMASRDELVQMLSARDKPRSAQGE